MPRALLAPGQICFSVGAGADISFDLEMIRDFDIHVRCIEPVEEYFDQARRTADGEARFSAHRAALAREDGPLRMQHTHHPGSNSLSSADLYDTHDYIQVPGRTLTSLAEELGDRQIDLLKLDIEGGEYDLVPTLDLHALHVRVFALQLHHNGGVTRARELIAHLQASGYELVGMRPVLKLTFARRDLL